MPVFIGLHHVVEQDYNIKIQQHWSRDWIYHIINHVTHTCKFHINWDKVPGHVNISWSSHLYQKYSMSFEKRNQTRCKLICFLSIFNLKKVKDFLHTQVYRFFHLLGKSNKIFMVGVYVSQLKFYVHQELFLSNHLTFPDAVVNNTFRLIS